MTAYRVEFSDAAKKQLRKLDPQIRVRLMKALNELAANPHGQQPQVKALKGDAPGDYRLRVGHYRVIYDLYDDRMWIWVVRAGHRSTIYEE